MSATVLQCSCCDRDYWPQRVHGVRDVLCDSCADWVLAFDLGHGPDTAAIAGPVRSVRDLLAGRSVDPADVAADPSTPVLLHVPRATADRWRDVLNQHLGRPHRRHRGSRRQAGLRTTMTDTFEDGRVDLRGTEIYTAARKVSEHFTAEWMRNNMGYAYRGQQLNEKASRELVQAVFQAVNATRLGEAEGSVARHPDGRTARRYYSAEKKRLQWLVLEPPSDAEATAVAIVEFPTGSKWEVVYSAPWKVT